MTLGDQCIIKVPGSTANLGPGFDSIGLAIDLYLTLKVEISETWSFLTTSSELQSFPMDEHHFICQIAKAVAAKFGCTLPSCKVVMDSDIPLARGLGSSAAAIVAGIELADYFGSLQLSKEEKLLLATQWEGHPDNVGASLYGGLVVGCYQEKEVDLISFPNASFELVAVIPKEMLLTKDSREVLPAFFSYSEAVKASSTANLLVAALLTKNWPLAGKMMTLDLFHQPYRKPLIPFYQEVECAAKRKGAFGVALSGAGPTVLCFTESGKGRYLAESLQKEYKQMSVQLLNLSRSGSKVYKVTNEKLYKNN